MKQRSTYEGFERGSRVGESSTEKRAQGRAPQRCTHYDCSYVEADATRRQHSTKTLMCPIVTFFTHCIVGLAMLVPLGCASSAAQQYPGYRERAESRVLDDVRISAAALSAEESAAVYGAPLAQRLIQPVWAQIENKGRETYWLLFPSLDPNFLPASEAAEAMSVGKGSTHAADLDRRFRELAFKNPVPPGQTVAGFVLTNLREGVKLLQIDLFGEGRTHSVSFLTTVPGLRVDYQQEQTRQRRLLATANVVDFTDDASFMAALHALPCCTTSKDGSRNGDPLNLVIVGRVDEAFPAMIRRGWSVTEAMSSGSIMRMMKSALAREQYLYAPVSNLYLYGRPQDLALQKARDTIHQRNHLRLWLSPMTYHGKPVWVGQISRDIGSRMTIHSPTLTTHKIDPDVDEAARALVEDMTYSQNLLAFGRVAGVGAAPRNAPRENLTRDPYFTDGLRLVLIFDSAPTSLAGIRFLPWEGGEDFIDHQQ